MRAHLTAASALRDGSRRVIGWKRCHDRTARLGHRQRRGAGRCGAAGDRAAFAGIYDRYADRLHDFCVGMLRDRDAAADCVQDVFCTAATQLPKLRDPDKLRPWLYAIARNEALRCIRERRREQVFDELPEAASDDAGPDTLAARSELADLIAEAAGGLVRPRPLGAGVGLPPRPGRTRTGRGAGRQPRQRHQDGVSAARNHRALAGRAAGRPPKPRATRGDAPELGAILADWDGKFSVLMRKRVARHIESCSTCEQERRRLVNPRALLGAVPVFIPAPWWLRGHTMGQVQADLRRLRYEQRCHGRRPCPRRVDSPRRRLRHRHPLPPHPPSHADRRTGCRRVTRLVRIDTRVAAPPERLR